MMCISRILTVILFALAIKSNAIAKSDNKFDNDLNNIIWCSNSGFDGTSKFSIVSFPYWVKKNVNKCINDVGGVMKSDKLSEKQVVKKINNLNYFKNRLCNFVSGKITSATYPYFLLNQKYNFGCNSKLFNVSTNQTNNLNKKPSVSLDTQLTNQSEICKDALMLWSSSYNKRYSRYGDLNVDQKHYEALLKMVEQNLNCEVTIKQAKSKIKFYENNNFVNKKLINNKSIIASNKSKDPNQRPLASLSDTSICYNATTTSVGKKVWNDRNYNFVGEAKFRGLDCGVTEKNKTVIASKSKNTKPSISSAELEKEKQKRKSLEQKLASLEQEKEKRIEQEKQKRLELEKKLAALQSEKKKQIKKAKQKEIGSGFYVSKFRHVVTNQHVVNQCKKITVGDSVNTQIPADLIASDKRNDLAILQTVSMEMASSDTKSFIRKLKMEIGPIVSGGLMRSDDVVGGEEIFVAGFPLANQISDSLKLSDGIVSSTKGYENDVSKFEITSVVRKGNSGGPIYDSKGNIVGVVVEQVNVSRSDNVNFAIKGSTVKQFLSAHNVPTKWSNRKDNIDTKDIYKIASKQTVMVVCHR